MTTTTIVKRLPDLAAEIQKEHALCEGSYRTALGHAVRVGELLAQAKDQLPHGDWLPWLAEHTEISARNAQRYMQLAGTPNAPALSHLGIEGALQAIAKPVQKPASSPGLRTVLGGIDQAEAEAALAELGPLPERDSFPSSGMERATWRQIKQALERVERTMGQGSADGLSKWTRRESLYEAARHAKDAGLLLSELAQSLG